MNYENETGERGMLNILKPVFVSKEVRDTKDGILEEELAIKEEKKKIRKKTQRRS